MPTVEHLPVTAKLVHKDTIDDVLISNGRSALPTWIAPDALEQIEFTEQELALLNTHFHSTALADGRQVLLRRSVPTFLPADTKQNADFDWVHAYYTPEKDGLFLNAKYIPEHHEQALAAEFTAPECRITEMERSRLSDVTDQIPCNERPLRRTYSMINDLQNYYFYRKHHEHVPGIMLIEVARQAMYAQIYQGKKLVRGDVTITVKSMNCDFDNYVDSNYPVTVTVQDCDLPADTPDGPFEARSATFYQRGKIVANIKIVGLSITNRLFKRLRNSKPEPRDWFVPVKGFAPSVLFQDDSGKRIEGKLRRVSETGMDIAFAKQPDAAKPMNFVVCIDGIGYVDGKAQPRQMQEDAEGVCGKVDMIDMSLDGKRKWCEAIKNYSHLDVYAEAS
jgi:hypothetical protein